jgi:hypothetical protein
MKTIRLTPIISLSIFSSLWLAVPSAVQAKPIERIVGSAIVNWTRSEIQVTGTGVLRPGMPQGAQRLMAQRAATVDAYRLLAEAVQGVQVFAETTVQNYTTSNDLIRIQVQAAVRGARPVGSTRYFSDGTVEVDVKMPLFGHASVAEAIHFGTAVKEQFAYPFFSPERYLAYQGYNIALKKPAQLAQNMMGYTGLVIDASGLAAEPAMGPFILGAGKRLHPDASIGIDPELIVKQGPLHYVEALEEALEDKERIGNRPLVIQAKAAVGSPVHSNILLSESNALQILNANKEAQFLEALKVVLVL